MDRRRFVRWAAALAAAMLFAGAGIWCLRARDVGRWVHIALTQGVDAAALEDRRWQAEQETVGFCFWGEDRQRQARCRQTGGSAYVTRVTVWGNPELLDCGALAWRDGCLIDEGTAQALFGTTLCGGQILYLDGEALPVLGTVRALRPTVVALAQPGDILDQCVLALPAEAGQWESFLLRFGLGGEVLDFYPLLALAEDLRLLFPMVLLFRLCSRLGKGWRTLTLRELPRRKGRRIVLALLLGAAGAWLAAKRLVIPRGWIPSRWSDFSFWGRLWEQERDHAAAIAFAALGSRQLQMLANVVKSMVASTAAALLALWATRRRNYADTAD